MQVDFASVIGMEHTGMMCMFMSLEETGLKGFLEVSNSVFEGSVSEFFANAKVISGKIVSFMENQKMVLTKDVFAETFGLSTDGMVSFLDIPTEIVLEMRRSEKVDLMVVITVCLKVNWAQVLFQVLVAMVNNPNHQSQGFAVQLSVLLERLVKADLGESVKLHPQKVLTNKSVHTYIETNLGVGPDGETSKVSGATASEQQSTSDSLPSLTNRAEKEAGQKKKPEKAAVEKLKKKKEKVVQTVKNQKVVVSKPVEARSQAAPTKSKSGTSSDEDSRRLTKLRRGDTKCKQVVESSDSESIVSIPPVLIMKKRTQNKKPVKKVAGNQADSQPGPTPDIPAEDEAVSNTAGAPEANMETSPAVER
ncbi:hypothetical protein F511_19768 [Dorcoceras hygrometricum]|uniref:Uncharacterized protein n=1 Tax=Dorcoceras hygrometricum TaxID=472368 RepID=A0A2Z7BKA3_9LAMI|nr:hypothetical protein F511_19768 [Dorcoceras hygrometricum]